MSSESGYSEEDCDQPTVGLISNMEARVDHQNAKRFKLLYGIATGLSIVLVTAILVWILKFREGFGWTDPKLQFYWHPLLMTFSMIFLFSQSIMVYRSARQLRKKTLKLAHAALHCLAFILVVIALKAVFDSHNKPDPPRPNLYTLHSWVGLMTVILFSLQFVAGFGAFLFPKFSKELRAVILPVHTNFGLTIFFMAIVSALLGLCEKALWSVTSYETYPSEGILMNFIGLLLVCFGGLVLYVVNDGVYKRASQPDDEISLTGQSD